MHDPQISMGLKVGIPSAFTSGQALRLRLIFALGAQRSVLAQDDNGSEAFGRTFPNHAESFPQTSTQNSRVLVTCNLDPQYQKRIVEACANCPPHLDPFSPRQLRSRAPGRRPVGRHLSRFCEEPPKKNRTCRQPRNFFAVKIFRVNYLESIFWGVYRALECKQLQQNQDFANLYPRKMFVHCISEQQQSEFVVFMGDWSRAGASAIDLLYHRN